MHMVTRFIYSSSWKQQVNPTRMPDLINSRNKFSGSRDACIGGKEKNQICDLETIRKFSLLLVTENMTYASTFA